MNYMKTALKVQEKFSKIHTVREYRVGGHVSVRIPRIDRSCTDLLRLPCIRVVEVVGKAQSLHRLRCKSGLSNSEMLLGGRFRALLDVSMTYYWMDGKMNRE